MQRSSPYSNHEAEKKQLPVAAIDYGTVIDHIPAGKAIILMKVLQLDSHLERVTCGLNLPSVRMKLKDLIKVDGRVLSKVESSQVAIFAPNATISIIEKYNVIEKYTVSLPEQIEQIIYCPNSQCITNHEKASRVFFISQHKHHVHLQCKYCEKIFLQNEITRYAL